MSFICQHCHRPMRDGMIRILGGREERLDVPLRVVTKTRTVLYMSHDCDPGDEKVETWMDGEAKVVSAKFPREGRPALVTNGTEVAREEQWCRDCVLDFAREG